MYRTVIVDSDPMLLFIYRKYLEEDKRFKIVGECDSMENNPSLLKTAKADLLILGSVGKGANKELLREIFKSRSGARVILVAADMEAVFFVDALQLGVVDCVLKPFTGDRFKAAMDRFVDLAAKTKKMKTADQRTFDFYMYEDGSIGDLTCHVNTKTAFRILDCLRKNPGNYHTVKELAQKLGLSSVTVRKYLKELSGAGEIVDSIEYGTGGHPSALYAVI